MRPPQESIRAAAPALRELSALLRAPTPLYARGLAMLNELLADGSGPLYARGGAAALERALAEVRSGVRRGRAPGTAGRPFAANPCEGPTPAAPALTVAQLDLSRRPQRRARRRLSVRGGYRS